ncbi:MAG TPA: PD-(D/E)XK nuclease superfamily protein [Polyangia bacterium]
MSGGELAVASGTALKKLVMALGERLGLQAKEEVPVGRRLWGSKRRIDVVLTHGETRQSLGIECKVQSSRGSAEEKIPATILDIAAWPIPGIIVFSGDGFSQEFRSYLHASGKAVEFEDLEDWLRMFFRLT